MAFAVVDARPEQVWSVLTDFDAWPRVFSDIQSVVVQPLDSGSVSVRRSNLRFGWSIEYTSVSTPRPEQGRIEFRLDPNHRHDVAEVSGVWEIRPSTDGAMTRLALYSRVESGLPIPRFVERRLLQSSLEHRIAEVAAEAKTRCISRHVVADSSQ